MIMRWNIRALVLIAAALGFGIAAAAAAPVVPSHELKGNYSVGTVGRDCINAGGTFFNGPNGGYGCATTQGTVNCTGKGKCTGTCQRCRQAVGGGKPGMTPPASVGNLQPPSANPPVATRHPVIGVSSGRLLPPSGSMATLYARVGHGRR